jgi:hypothetical protein
MTREQIDGRILIKQLIVFDAGRRTFGLGMMEKGRKEKY